ncbi:PAQR family membrane homeostasis protein TrhA [Alkalicoccus luteus]|uniref:Hemolysin III family protein n=1 Tax=Alkalicoccus luteus TaxID=1237094 RepID=A0A969PX66_9BACI|nr:hemolysin III family protein [Alkalicoccus luteus]NJP39109.1 hemolysin III family protein [Alkalicoccus luteus]
MSTFTFTREEEKVNAATHGVGIVISLLSLILLTGYAVEHGTTAHVVSFALFGVSMLLLYTSSTLLHALPEGRAKDIFEIADHASIYFFIAGTYTPFLFIAVQGWLGWALFGIVWGFALLGTVLKIFFVKKYMFLSTLGYVILGWQIVFAWSSISAVLPAAGLQLLVLGGILYTGGAVFYMWRGFKYHHAVWHLFVLAGTISHIAAVAHLLVI